MTFSIAIAVALERADDMRIQRRPLGQVAERAEEESAQVLLSAGDVLGRLDGGDRLASCVELLSCLVEQASVEQPLVGGGSVFCSRRVSHLEVRRLQRAIVGDGRRGEDRRQYQHNA